MSQDQIRRIQAAIADCDKFIATESARDAGLRPKNVQQHLDFCIAHKAKLLAMLAA